MTLLRGVTQMAVQRSPHGFRSTFRTWVDDTRPEDDQAAERALAHEEENKVSSAYRRSDLFDRRKPLMEAWGEYAIPNK